MERAKEIALTLEVYVNGSLSMFAKPTNVDMANRLICFNIQSLGSQLKAVAMLYMLEFINTRVMTTERSSSACATWVYFDEIYLLLQNELSAQFLFTSWKRFRKYNAFDTGITPRTSKTDCPTVLLMPCWPTANSCVCCIKPKTLIMLWNSTVCPIFSEIIC